MYVRKWVLFVWFEQTEWNVGRLTEDGVALTAHLIVLHCHRLFKGGVVSYPVPPPLRCCNGTWLENYCHQLFITTNQLHLGVHLHQLPTFRSRQSFIKRLLMLEISGWRQLFELIMKLFIFLVYFEPQLLRVQVAYTCNPSWWNAIGLYDISIHHHTAGLLFMSRRHAWLVRGESLSAIW